MQNVSNGETPAQIGSNIAANQGHGFSNLNNLSTITSSTCQPNITAVPSMGITANRTRHLKRLQNGFEGYVMYSNEVKNKAAIHMTSFLYLVV